MCIKYAHVKTYKEKGGKKINVTTTDVHIQQTKKRSPMARETIPRDKSKGCRFCACTFVLSRAYKPQASFLIPQFFPLF